jgi:hypothetical protein
MIYSSGLFTGANDAPVATGSFRYRAVGPQGTTNQGNASEQVRDTSRVEDVSTPRKRVAHLGQPCRIDGASVVA